MAIRKILLCAVIAFLGSFSVFAKKNVQVVTYQPEFKLNNINKRLGYQLLDDGKIVFVFDSSRFGIKTPKRVFLEGSFNGWAKKNSSWELEKYKYSTWTYECNLEDVMVPGNSGFPEFKFYVIAEVEYEVRIVEATSIRKKDEIMEPTMPNPFPGFIMATNILILLSTDNPSVVIENTKTAEKLKKLKQFNLENPADVATISNFRLVPGTSKLFRGYHPY